MTEHDSTGDKLSPWQMYFFRVFLGFDQMLNVFLFGFPDESISGRLGRSHIAGKPKWFARYGKIVVDWLFLTLFNERNHCLNAMEPEEKFEQRPELWRWYK